MTLAQDFLRSNMAQQYKQLDLSSQNFNALANGQQQGGRLIVARRP